MSKIKTKADSMPVLIEQTLEYRPLINGYCAYKHVRSVKLAGEGWEAGWFRGMLGTIERQGIAKESMLKAFQDGQHDKVPGEILSLWPQELLDLVQRHGYQVSEAHAALLDQVTEHNRKPFDAPQDWILVKDDLGSHMVFDVSTPPKPYPVGLRYDYMSGYSSDGVYDLKKMLPYLQAHPQVSAPEGGTLQIESVPYYNVSEGCNQHIAFVFSPTAEQMQALWTAAQALYPKYPCTVLHHVAFDMDLIGLRAAGIARKEKYGSGG